MTAGTYDVRFWQPRRLGDTTRGRWRVRWRTDTREHCRSFTTRALADAFLTDLKTAARAGTPFDASTGLPAGTAAARAATTFYQHAQTYTDTKWPVLAASSRRSIAEALAVLAARHTTARPGAPNPGVLHRALMRHAFNPAGRTTSPDPDAARALAWVQAASLPVTALTDPAALRHLLDGCTTTQAGRPAAATVINRRRGVLYNVCRHAIEAGLLPDNPLDRIQWTAPAVADTVDRRVVANPTQIRDLLAAVRAQGARGEHLEAFFGCLYYAGMRPGEAVALTAADCALPDSGWGRIDLTTSEPEAGRTWTDTGQPRDRRGLKHRSRTAVRPVPIPPELVELLRTHLKTYGTTTYGRLFRTSRGNPLQDTGYGRVWHRARSTALTPTQAASPLARRPYDLRHAAVSLWLNAGVPPTEVARRAGHGVAVLLRVYANCIDGTTTADNHRIDTALDTDALPRPE